ncbi:hypothetical protein [Bdellovibrio svalbardensis]|uniref:Uncharacterized protein n=1 Tax=Bdellovibrio svalbardensis TaxID=2972972 RepID=A0ABT6DJB7_9BACT|nr:hypothetical protein [Bdellovibrio svalbardensis]MDG0816320.1 hypothetical protein [Bdellovibrio svalbardensis]
MKKLFVGLLAFAMLSSAHAAKTSGTGQIGSGNVNISKEDFLDSYIVGKLAIEGPYYAVEFKVNAAGDRIVFRNGNMDEVSPNEDCVGNGISIKKNIMSLAVACKSMGGATLNFDINVEGLTKEALAKGAKVMVRSEATQGQWVPFNIIQRKKSFF